MIRRLRKRHLWMWHLFGLAAFAVFFAGLAARETWPVGASPIAAGGEVLHRAELATTPPIVVRVIRDTGLFLELDPGRAPELADVLVSWRIGEGPMHGIVLGTLDGAFRRRYPVPIEVDAGAGTLVLYSLAHDRELARLELDLGGAR